MKHSYKLVAAQKDASLQNISNCFMIWNGKAFQTIPRCAFYIFPRSSSLSQQKCLSLPF